VSSLFSQVLICCENRRGAKTADLFAVAGTCSLGPGRLPLLKKVAVCHFCVFVMFSLSFISYVGLIGLCVCFVDWLLCFLTSNPSCSRHTRTIPPKPVFFRVILPQTFFFFFFFCCVSMIQNFFKRNIQRMTAPWVDKTVDLDAYFARICYRGSREPNLETLQAIIYAHVIHIPFESLDVATGSFLNFVSIVFLFFFPSFAQKHF